MHPPWQLFLHSSCRQAEQAKQQHRFVQGEKDLLLWDSRVKIKELL